MVEWTLYHRNIKNVCLDKGQELPFPIWKRWIAACILFVFYVLTIHRKWYTQCIPNMKANYSKYYISAMKIHYLSWIGTGCNIHVKRWWGEIIWSSWSDLAHVTSDLSCVPDDSLVINQSSTSRPPSRWSISRPPSRWSISRPSVVHLVGDQSVVHQSST